MTERYPIVYIRGYAMREAEVAETFNDPYYGFNSGAVQVKQGEGETPFMAVFESPVVRLLKDDGVGYRDSFNSYVDPQNHPIPDSVPEQEWRSTLWVFRFYDEESELFAGDRPTFEIENYAERLWLFLDAVRRACSSPDGFKVNLVAHSMGGLICRCYLQNTELEQSPGGALRALRDRGRPIPEPVEINKLFTYGTPHGGITFRRGLGWVESVRDFFGSRGSDAFGPDRMRAYLSLGAEEPLNRYRSARGGLPLERILCMVGTNYQDYVVWSAKKSVGPGSDGLVAIESAHVSGASRAFIHRAHSGPFGMVNSEEGYQNLIRFLFGDIRYEVQLEPVTVVGSLPGQKESDTLEFLLMDVDLITRGVRCFLHTRRESNVSAMSIPIRDGHQADPDPTVLFTGFLDNSRRLSGDPYVRGAIRLRIEPHFVDEGLLFDSKYEGANLLADTLYLRIHAGDGKLAYSWGSPDKPKPVEEDDRGFLVPLPPATRKWIDSPGIRISFGSWS